MTPTRCVLQSGYAQLANNIFGASTSAGFDLVVATVMGLTCNSAAKITLVRTGFKCRFKGRF